MDRRFDDGKCSYRYFDKAFRRSIDDVRFQALKSVREFTEQLLSFFAFLVAQFRRFEKVIARARGAI